MTRRSFSKAAVLVLAATLATPAASRAQGQAGAQNAPALIFTAKSTSEILGDLRYLLTAVLPADNPQLAAALQGLDQLKDPAALQGVDPSKPFGAFGSFSDQPGQPPSAVVFIPVRDAQAFLGFLGNVGLTVEADNSAPGFTHKVTAPNTPLPFYATSGGGYVYFSFAPVGGQALKAMDPTTLLPKRPGAGDLSLTLRLDRIPANVKDQFVAGMDQSMAAKNARQPGEDDAKFETRMAGQKMARDAIMSLIRDGRELSLDVLIDQKAQFFGVEMNASATPGSGYASALRKLGAMKSKFRGVVANAAVGGTVAVPVTPALRDAIGKGADQARAEALAKAKKDGKVDANTERLMDTVFDALRTTLTSDTLDFGAAIQGPTPATSGGTSTYAFVSAMAVKKGKALESALRDAYKASKPEEKKGITLDFAKAADGTPIHKVVPDKADDPGPLGESVAYVALKDDVFAFAAGKNGQAALNTALSGGQALAGAGGGNSGAMMATTAAPQVDLFVSASKLGDLGQKPAERDAMRAAAAEVFTGANAKKDRFSLILRAQGDAMTLRLGGDVPALKFLVRLGEITGAGKAIQ